MRQVQNFVMFSTQIVFYHTSAWTYRSRSIN